ncbi:MAG: hypothetical protein KJ018_05490 [Burkholderiales bacterium]|nr:hypothetical protein [Burkholderiales bacterium]
MAFAFSIGAAAQTSSPRLLFIDPQCPKPDEVVTIRAGGLVAEPLGVSVQGSTIKAVVTTYEWRFAVPPPTSYVNQNVGPLPPGQYRVEVYGRQYRTPPAEYGPETLLYADTVVVRASPPVCEARRIVATTSRLLSAGLREPYNGLVEFTVVDAHGFPVPNAPVRYERLAPLGEHSLVASKPDVESGFFIISDAAGRFRAQARANGVPGVFQYKFYLEYANLRPSAHFVFANRAWGATTDLLPVVEFHHEVFNHYFMTRDFAEMAKLDEAPGHPSRVGSNYEGTGGWRRTGGVFLVYGSAAQTTPAPSPVCRFYGLPSAGLDSHFFSASPQECEDVQRRFADAWLLESLDVFRVVLPDPVTGACPFHTQPVYRIFNNRADANHRYGTYSQLASATSYFTSSGPWIPEGYGPAGVVMCAPT